MEIVNRDSPVLSPTQLVCQCVYNLGYMDHWNLAAEFIHIVFVRSYVRPEYSKKTSHNKPATGFNAKDY